MSYSFATEAQVRIEEKGHATWGRSLSAIEPNKIDGTLPSSTPE